MVKRGVLLPPNTVSHTSWSVVANGFNDWTPLALVISAPQCCISRIANCQFAIRHFRPVPYGRSAHPSTPEERLCDP
eukprot:6159420-Prymnesium_polylepis.1